MATSIFSLALTAIGTEMQIKSQKNAAKLQAIQYKEQAKDEQSAARDREIERKRRLISALSAQAAESGAAGVDPNVGTRAAIAFEDIRQKGFDSQLDSARTNRRSLLLRSAAKNVEKQASLAAHGTRLQAAASTMGGFA